MNYLVRLIMRGTDPERDARIRAALRPKTLEALEPSGTTPEGQTHLDARADTRLEAGILKRDFERALRLNAQPGCTRIWSLRVHRETAPE